MTTKIRISKKKKTVSKGVAHRKKLPRFGEAKPEGANHNISMVSVEQIFLEKRASPSPQTYEAVCVCGRREVVTKTHPKTRAE
jgi:hypothetical protein